MNKISIKKIFSTINLFLIAITLVIHIFFINLVKLEKSDSGLKLCNIFTYDSLFSKDVFGKYMYNIYNIIGIITIITIGLIFIVGIIGLFLKLKFIYKIYNFLALISLFCVCVSVVYSFGVMFALSLYFDKVPKMKTDSVISLCIIAVLTFTSLILNNCLKESYFNKKKEDKNKNKANLILEYKKLLDLEIITKEEFENKKIELLS